MKASIWDVYGFGFPKKRVLAVIRIDSRVYIAVYTVEQSRTGID